MPVEIRELVIKTEIVSRDTPPAQGLSLAEMRQLKMQVLAECRRQLRREASRNDYIR